MESKITVEVYEYEGQGPTFMNFSRVPNNDEYVIFNNKIHTVWRVIWGNKYPRIQLSRELNLSNSSNFNAYRIFL